MDLIDLLERVDEFLDNYVDVTDGEDGSPRPNTAMSLQVDVRAGIEELTAVKLAIETFNAAMRAGDLDGGRQASDLLRRRTVNS